MKDKWLRIVGIPLVAALMHLPYADSFSGWDAAWFADSGVALAVTYILWEGNRALLIWGRRWFARVDQTPSRLAVHLGLSIMFTLAATVGLDWFFRTLFDIGLCSQERLLTHGFLLNMLPTLFVTSLYEGAYFFSQWKKNLQRSEALARASMESELETLRSQLDPHFLFNSLNTLAALIEDDNEPAHTYLEQLADVYRYVLVSRDKTTVPLREEMAFVDAYLYLNKTRFRNDLQVEQHITPAAYAASVAPLSLQMLVENAIKHNIISPENPLCVTLSTEPNSQYVRVQNNVQPKTGLEQSTKVGLRNIINRYRLLSEHPVEVQHDNGLFTVRLPLLDSIKN